MTIYVAVPKKSEIRLWGLDSRHRLRRQLTEIMKEAEHGPSEFVWLDKPGDAPEGSSVLLINGEFLFEKRTLKGVLQNAGKLLLYPHPDRVAAVLVERDRLDTALNCFEGELRQVPTGFGSMYTRDLAAFDEYLRRSTRPLLEPISPENRRQLENELYGNAYRGITDLVTKFVFPKPAKQAVHWCARLGITPNMVTTMGLLLVIVASYCFIHGQYAWGLVAGWCMTFLDTVDGKLARVTVRSSKAGHLFDHFIDLFHPPFWYIFWGMSLQHFEPVMGMDRYQFYWLIVAAYVTGRLAEGLFTLLGRCSIFTWRPLDAWFRLVTARRNPSLIMLTVSAMLKRPDWGFIAVALWSAITSAILLLRLLYATASRVSGGPLRSWLEEEDVASGPHAGSYRIFGATRGAYARTSRKAPV